MKTRKYEVVGNRAVAGVEPGGTVIRDPDDPSTQRLVRHNRIRAKTPTKVGEDKEQTDDY